MDKEKAIADFFESLRVSLNNASVYFNDHPLFAKSAKDLKEKTDTLLSFLSPFKIGIAAHSLFVEDKYLDKLKLYKELAEMFHKRKIKNIIIKEGVTVEELIAFLSKVSMPQRDILKSGGLRKILGTKEESHIAVEELDYSQILANQEGEEYKDIWPYLLQEAISDESPQKINELADNFSNIVGKFKVKDILEDKELRTNIEKFLLYLKDKQNEKFGKCGKEIVKVILRDKVIGEEEKIEKAKEFFSNLSEEDFADTLFDEMLSDAGFDGLSFKLFSRIVDKEKHSGIANSLSTKVAKGEVFKSNPQFRKKIKTLFSASENQLVSEIYSKTLFSYLKDDASTVESIVFDRNLLSLNYRYALINMLSDEKNSDRQEIIIERILNEWDKIIKEENLEYLKYLTDLIVKKKTESLKLSNALKELLKRVNSFVENSVLNGNAPDDFMRFLDLIEENTLEVSLYFDKIFKENKLDPSILRLLFKSFPKNLPAFYESLKNRITDIEFLVKLIESLKTIDSPFTYEILKFMFSYSNNLIKREVIQAMKSLSTYDEAFFFSLLKSEDTALRKTALMILARDTNVRNKALRELFSSDSPFGIKNGAILDNISIVEDLELKEAKEFLLALGRRRFFWNKNVRAKAQRLIERWNVREN